MINWKCNKIVQYKQMTVESIIDKEMEYVLERTKKAKVLSAVRNKWWGLVGAEYQNWLEELTRINWK